MKRLFFRMLMGVILALPCSAYASTVIYSGSNSIGIDHLQVGSSFYDVDFLHDSFDDLWPSQNPVFWDDQGGAQSASNAINTVLNNESPVPLVSTSGSGIYNVPFEKRTIDGKIGTVVNLRHTDFGVWWGSNSSAGYLSSGSDYVYARFSPVVPIPGALWLLGSGLFGLVAVRWRKGEK